MADQHHRVAGRWQRAASSASNCAWWPMSSAAAGSSSSKSGASWVNAATATADARRRTGADKSRAARWPMSSAASAAPRALAMSSALSQPPLAMRVAGNQQRVQHLAGKGVAPALRQNSQLARARPAASRPAPARPAGCACLRRRAGLARVRSRVDLPAPLRANHRPALAGLQPQSSALSRVRPSAASAPGCPARRSAPVSPGAPGAIRYKTPARQSRR